MRPVVARDHRAAGTLANGRKPLACGSRSPVPKSLGKRAGFSAIACVCPDMSGLTHAMGAKLRSSRALLGAGFWNRSVEGGLLLFARVLGRNDGLPASLTGPDLPHIEADQFTEHLLLQSVEALRPSPATPDQAAAPRSAVNAPEQCSRRQHGRGV